MKALSGSVACIGNSSLNCKHCIFGTWVLASLLLQVCFYYVDIADLITCSEIAQVQRDTSSLNIIPRENSNGIIVNDK